jgi:hypothetical protein
MGLRERLTEGVERAVEGAGYNVVPHERLSLLEASDARRRELQRDLDLLAYTALDYVGGSPQELKAVERRKLAQQSRVAWMKDPQAGAAVDLMNDFTFGRGIPRPKCNDETVQEIVDEAWDDPDNQLVLTSYAAQISLGIDLSLQSNLFILVFDDGDDGKVKLGILDHDSVETVVRDPDNRLRILYFLAREVRQEWDYENDIAKTSLRPEVEKKVTYYEHWRNVEDLKEQAESGNRDLPELAPPAKTGDGKVFQIAINKTTEMAFGHPVMDRLLRWYNAYNKFMDARVDIMEASAAFVMKRKVKGTPNQVQKMATQMLSRRSTIGASLDYPEAMAGPKSAGVITENENVTHEDFNINTNAPAAAQDAQMLRAQISAATRFPQSYYGDAANSTLATATSLELPVLKAVENRQEVFEAVVRFFVDRVIERAVEAGRISSDLSEEERARLEADKAGNETEASAAPGTAKGGDPVTGTPPSLQLVQAHEDAVEDEEATARDLGYEFSMPNPLKRMMGDLVTAIQNIARTFDPNNTNMELSRVLLQVALADGLEIEDAAGVVEKIFPEGYVDPAILAAQQAPAMPDEGDPQFGPFAPAQPGAVGPDGQRHQAGNAYGAPMNASPPGAMKEAALPEPLKREIRDRRGSLEDELEVEIAGALPGSKARGSA